jgi:hypothetical protein
MRAFYIPLNSVWYYFFPARFLIEVGNDDAGDLVGVGLCDGSSYALARTRDYPHLVFQHAHHYSPVNLAASCRFAT